MSLEIYSTASLMGVLQNLKRVPNFILSTFFTRVQTFTTKEVYFDEVTEVATVAPFVHPMMQGKMIETEGFNTKSFKPAYVKPKLTISPDETLTRMAGEALLGDMSPEQRRQAITVAKVAKLQRMWERRKEIMAVEALISGKQTVIGDGVNAVVDFGRDSSLTLTLTGAARWSVVDSNGDGTADIRGQIETWGSLLTGFNASAEMLIMDVKAWNMFRLNKGVQKELDRNNLGSISSIITSPQIFEEAVPQYKGKIGSVEIWVYNATFKDPVDGSAKQLIPDNTAILTGRAIQGIQAYGAILDHGSLMAQELFVKSWEEEDPSVRYIMAQSAPLMVPYRVNAAVTVTVTSAS